MIIIAVAQIFVNACCFKVFVITHTHWAYVLNKINRLCFNSNSNELRPRISCVKLTYTAHRDTENKAATHTRTDRLDAGDVC